MNFDGLCPELKSALKDRGIVEPTPPQADAMPIILNRDNLLLVAPTGIGKTEAAMIPILDSIFRTREKNKGIRCLYITPLRALNRDMMSRMESYGKALAMQVMSIHTRHRTLEQSL